MPKDAVLRPLCPPSPASCLAPARSSLLIQESAGQRSTVWQWRAATSASDFGNPVTTTRYELCIYDGSGLALRLAEIGWNCSKKRGCWRVTGPNGLGYTSAQPNQQRVVLTGGDDKKGSILVRSRHAATSTPALPLSLATPVTVQWFDTTNSVCWGATYSPSEITENTATVFKARIGY